MKLLQERIRREGIARSHDVLIVSHFLNHQLDPQLFLAMAKEWQKRFKGKRIDKIMTIEASGIALAVVAGLVMEVPVVFAKKRGSVTLDDDQYCATVYSYTQKKSYAIRVEKDLLKPGEHLLIIDDFLANGQAVLGLAEIARQAECVLEGVGIAIEKGYQPGAALLRERGLDVQSLAVIRSMDPQPGAIEFDEAEAV